VAIVAIALSPVPPILPNSQTKAGGTAAYVVSLLVTAAVLALVVVPVGVVMIGAIFGIDQWVPLGSVASVLAITIVVPLVVGMAVHHFAPELAAKAAKPVSILGYGLLVIAVIPILFGQWELILSMVGNGTLLVLALFTLCGVAVGHFLGGPDPDNRSVLALATGTRHPGVALAIAAATFPEQHAVMSVVLWHLVVGAIVSGPYIKWRQRSHGTDPASHIPPAAAGH
jgi:bile acid:Na+ symporter, BASS family